MQAEQWNPTSSEERNARIWPRPGLIDGRTFGTSIRIHWSPPGRAKWRPKSHFAMYGVFLFLTLTVFFLLHPSFFCKGRLPQSLWEYTFFKLKKKIVRNIFSVRQADDGWRTYQLKHHDDRESQKTPPAPDIFALLTLAYLFSGTVGTLSGPAVVVCPMEGHVAVALAVLVVHLVALVDGDVVHLDGAAMLGGHQDLGAHHLAWKKEQ